MKKKHLTVFDRWFKYIEDDYLFTTDTELIKEIAYKAYLKGKKQERKEQKLINDWGSAY